MLLGKPAVQDHHVRDDQQIPVGGEDVRLAAAGLDDLRYLRLPGHGAGKAVLAGLEIGGKEIAGAETVLGVDEIQPLRMRRRVEAAERMDREPGFLRQVADEEIHFGELRRRDRLAFQLVDPLDVLADDDAVGAAGEPDLRRHDRMELTAVSGKHVHGRHRAGQLAFVQVGPVLVFADRQLHLEPVIPEEPRRFARLEAAVGRDQPCIAGVLADLDRDDVVFELEGRGRREPRHFHLHFAHRRRFTLGGSRLGVSSRRRGRAGP